MSRHGQSLTHAPSFRCCQPTSRCGELCFLPSGPQHFPEPLTETLRKCFPFFLKLATLNVNVCSTLVRLSLQMPQLSSAKRFRRGNVNRLCGHPADRCAKPPRGPHAPAVTTAASTQ